MLPGLVTLALLALAVPSVAGLAVSALAAMMPVPLCVWTLLGILYFGWRRERRVMAEHLADEIASRVVLAEELDILTGPRVRSRALWRTLQTRGPLTWYARRQLYDLEIQLAFKNWHVARGEQPPASLGVWTPAQYRDRIAAVRLRYPLPSPKAAESHSEAACVSDGPLRLLRLRPVFSRPRLLRQAEERDHHGDDRGGPSPLPISPRRGEATPRVHA